MLSDAFVRVWCDRCEGEGEEIQLTAIAHHRSWDERNVDGELRRCGWRVDGDTHICPSCLEEEEDDAR